MAVMIAAKYSVHRVSSFGGWADARHGWVELGATPSANYFSLIHVRDTVYARTCWAYKELKLATACPAANPPTLMENSEPPFGTAQLVFNLGPVRKQADGVTPVQPMLNAWRSTLGDNDAGTYLDEVDTCPDKANNQLDDADQDRIGDVCDSTPRGTTPPVITAPGVTADATGPTGAAVTANATFAVTVRGAPEQLALLVTKVGGSRPLAALIGTLDPSRPLQRLAACVALRAFVVLASFVAPTRASEWVTGANRIKAVLAC